MIIGFNAKNYRSIKDEISIDFRAEVHGSERDETFPGYFSKNWDIRVLPVVALFGQNASGKSNVLNALTDILYILSKGSIDFKDSKSKSELDFNDFFKPFAFDPSCALTPIEFSIRLLLDEHIYSYALSIKDYAVVYEKLSIDSPGDGPEKSLVFERKCIDKNLAPNWKWGDNPATQLPENARILVKGLKDSRIYLSLLADTYDLGHIKRLKKYLARVPPIVSPANRTTHVREVVRVLKETKGFSESASKFLSYFDVPIEKLIFDDTSNFLYSGHKSWNGDPITFNFNNESEGTQQLLTITLAVFQALSAGTILLVDELDMHLHPMLTHQLLQLFQSPRVNKKNAQLFFTTHDTTLMDQELLRREQYYLVNRDSKGCTTTQSISEFGVRKDLVLAKAYLEGRLSGLPVLKDGADLERKVSELLELHEFVD